MRALWSMSILAGAVLVGLVSSPLLPGGVDLLVAYLSISILWVGVATLAAVAAGQLSGLLTPLIMSVGATRALPWGINLIYRGDLSLQRQCASAGIAVLAVLIYGRFGMPQDRRV